MPRFECEGVLTIRRLIDWFDEQWPDGLPLEGAIIEMTKRQEKEFRAILTVGAGHVATLIGDNLTKRVKDEGVKPFEPRPNRPVTFRGVSVKVVP